MKLGKSLGKLPVLSRASRGFVGERMRERSLQEAFFLLEEGATAQQVERVLEGFGFPSGPFALGDVAALDRARLARTAGERRIAVRVISDQEILERYLCAMINEGARILEEGVAARPLEIDMIWLHGYGFPVYRGGPLFYADALGVPVIYEAVRKYEREVGAEHWTPAGLLARLADAGQGFYGGV
jgi:3-hydroxyacyl-CoA dehydrogenase